MPPAPDGPTGDHLAELATYLAATAQRDTPAAVTQASLDHVIDTVAAIVSGHDLPAGQRGAEVAVWLGGQPEATILGTATSVGVTAAALANGMAAHANETDDSHAPTLSHPGCAIVPAALAVAEWQHASGADLLAAVAAGYDVGCRIGRALGRAAVDLRFSHPSSHALVGTFGAAAAAAVLVRADERSCRYILSYAAQSASGTTSWQRDVDHVEKAYVFGGSPAQSGVLSAVMVTLGCTGVDNVFEGHPNYLEAISSSPMPEELSADLTTRFEVTLTNVKRYPVGSPAQAAVQAAEEIVRDHHPDPATIAAIDILLPEDLANVVNDRHMPDINVQYLVAGTLLDGRCTFAMAHDTARMSSPGVRHLREHTTLIADPTRTGTRSAHLRVHLTSGTTLTRTVEDVLGTAQHPMTPSQVAEKAIDVMTPATGHPRAQDIVEALQHLTDLPDVAALPPLLRRPDASPSPRDR